MKILIPLKRNDHVKDLIPYIDKVIRPGMQAIFLVPYPVDGFRGSKEDSEISAVEEGKRLVEYYGWENNRKKARHKVSCAVEFLSSRNIEVAVEMYAGSLRRAIKQYTANGDVHLIVAGTGIGERIAGFLNGSNSVLELFRRPAFLPALLIQPKR